MEYETCYYLSSPLDRCRAPAIASWFTLPRCFYVAPLPNSVGQRLRPEPLLDRPQLGSHPVPAFRAALTMVVLSLEHKLPKASSIRITG